MDIFVSNDDDMSRRFRTTRKKPLLFVFEHKNFAFILKCLRSFFVRWSNCLRIRRKNVAFGCWHKKYRICSQKIFSKRRHQHFVRMRRYVDRANGVSCVGVIVLRDNGKMLFVWNKLKTTVCSEPPFSVVQYRRKTFIEMRWKSPLPWQRSFTRKTFLFFCQSKHERTNSNDRPEKLSRKTKTLNVEKSIRHNRRVLRHLVLMDDGVIEF